MKLNFIFDRVLKTIEGSFIFVIYANINASSEGFLYAVSTIGILTAFSSIPNINPYLQRFASTNKDNIALSYLFEKIIAISIMIFIFLVVSNRDFKISELFLIVSMGAYSFVQFFYLNNKFNEVFKVTIFITFSSIVLQIIVAFSHLPYQYLFVIKGVGYLTLVFVLILKYIEKISFSLLSFFDIKEQFLLYFTGCIFGFISNYDVLHYSSLQQPDVTEYFTVKKVFDFLFVIVSWWGISLPNKFNSDFSLKEESKKILFYFSFVLSIFLLVYCLSFNFFSAYTYLTVFILYPIVFILDVFFTKFSVYMSINHIELIKYIYRAIFILLAINVFDVELKFYPLCYFLVCVSSYIFYIFYFLTKKKGGL